MIYLNARLFVDGRFCKGGFQVKDGRFMKVRGAGSQPFSPAAPDEITDLHGATVIPGLIDVHTHGNSGVDFRTCSIEGLTAMADFLAQNGITSFAATSSTQSIETLESAYKTAALFHKNPTEKGARLEAIHMEGPFFSHAKKGAQNEAFIIPPDADAFRRLYEASEGLIRITDIAPEAEGAIDYIREVSRITKVSVAHTNAVYEEACAAFDAGATHLTHTFNAMTGIHHRAPGVIPAASERENVIAELIGDGLHVHPSVIRTAFRLFPDRICLVSDTIASCGLPDGVYDSCGLTVIMKDHLAHLEDGTIAGAATPLYQDMLNVISYGIPAEKAILAATLIPAREIGLDAEIGSIEEGKRADFIITDDRLQLGSVYIEGRKVR